MNEINALMKEIPEKALAPSAMWGQSKTTAVYETGSEPSLDTKSANALILDISQPPEKQETNFCCL